jgi:hypothetical protein
MRASSAIDLPCPWVPLQSMTAAASRRNPWREVAFGEFAGQSRRDAPCVCCAPGSRGVLPKEGGHESVVERNEPLGIGTGLPAAEVRIEPIAGRSRLPTRHASPRSRVGAGRREASFTSTATKHSEGAFSACRPEPKRGSNRRVPPTLRIDRSRAACQETSEPMSAGRAAEAIRLACRGAGRRLALLAHRSGHRCKTRSVGNRRHLPWGSGPFGV